MRILYVVSYYKPAYLYGGPVRCTSSLCEAMARLGARVTVFTTNANGPTRLDVPLRQPVDVDGVTVWYFPLALNGIFYYAPELSAALSSQVSQFDLAVLGALWTYSSGPAVAACNRVRIPYIIPLHGQLFPWALRHKRWRKRLYLALFARRYLNGATALHCTDPIEAAAVARLGLRPPLFIVPNGLDVSRFARLPARGNLRQRLGIPDWAVMLLFLGRLHPIKRPDIAISVLAAVQSLPVEVHLVLAGPDEGRLGLTLQAQAQHLGCADRLHMTGLLRADEVLQALADADLLLMPSEVQENFGMSAAEAMAAGLPVLVSEGVPVGRWAEEAGAGRMVPCTAEAFAQATRELLSMPARLQVMGKRGRGVAQQQFDISAVAQQMLAQYQSIVTSGRPLSGAAFGLDTIQTS